MVESRIVIPVVVGSSPIGHPIIFQAARNPVAVEPAGFAPELSGFDHCLEGS